MKKMWACVLGLHAAAGCVATDGSEGSAPEPQGSVDQAIQGGVVDTGDPQVGYLRVLRNDNGVVSYDSCTATMLAPMMLLTAAHCVPRPGTGDAWDGFYTGPGSPVSSPNQLPANLIWHGIAEHHIYPGDSYHPGTYDFSTDPFRCPAAHVDLAVVRLSQSITGISFFSGYQHLPTVFAPTQCTVAGYGFHGTTLGQKYSATMTLKTPSDASGYYGPGQTGIKAWWDPGNSSDNGITDGGDSGSALNCGPGIIGVTSCFNHDVDFRAPGGTQTFAPIYLAGGIGPAAWLDNYWCAWTGFLCI